MIKIFFVGHTWKDEKGYKQLRKKLSWLTPNLSGKWKNIKAVQKRENADWIVVIEDTWDSELLAKRGIGKKQKVMVFPREPPYVRKKNYVKFGLKWGLTYKNIYHTLANIDLLGLNYDQLLNLKSPIFASSSFDRKRICCIISGKKHTDGAELRLSFLKNFVDKYPCVIDIYGRGNLEFLGSDWKGPVDNKWNVLKDYEMSLCMENGQVENYFTEKITDVILSWSFPIYWGCPNINEYFESGSYHYLDIKDTIVDPVDRLKYLIDQGLPSGWELSLKIDRLKILNEFNIWNNIWKIANKIK